MVDVNQYFTEEEKITILSDLINAEYRCGYTGNAISDIDIKKYRDNIIKSDSYEDKLKLADELLPSLIMKINLNKTSMFVIDFYLIEPTLLRQDPSPEFKTMWEFIKYNKTLMKSIIHLFLGLGPLLPNQILNCSKIL
jgi:hypothetical protein